MVTTWCYPVRTLPARASVPVTRGHPLLALDNVILTPHIGGATYDTEANHSRMIADDLARLLSGERPRFLANAEVMDS